MSRIFIVGDCHGDLQNLIRVKDKYCDLTKEDYVIICGDFGFIWKEKSDNFEQFLLNEIENYPFTTLFIDGNHENFFRLNNYLIEEWHGGRVHRIGKNIFHLMRGEVFEIDNKKFFCFGGAKSPDKAYRIPYKTWWPEEIPIQKEYDNAIKNLEKINYSPDYIITHTLPDFFMRELYGGRYVEGDKAAYMLNDFLLLCTYKKWYCGHHHMDIKVRDNLQICFKKIYEIGVN